MLPSNIHKQAGVTMVEVLVTIIILAIGFLGLASVQLNGARNVASSNYRTLATIYAYDMAERMRANQAAVTLNSYDAVSTVGAADPGCGSTCTPAQVADLDEFEWSSLITANPVDGGLPNGVGTVTYANANDTYTITIAWSEADKNAVDAVTQSFDLIVRI
jgi:type IV pilus assembly protein PilV